MPGTPSASRGGGPALRAAVRHLNAPLPTTVSEQTALGWLTRRDWTVAEQPVVRALLDETEPEILVDLVLTRAATYDDLARCADLLLPSDHRNRVWLEERRHVGLA